ncbi:MAG: hypothetical protein NTW61_05905 [Candidatus Melainabacteria bacterium]|jgi:hypothetical protein|nr:hypothetical protein [Candidatus Melainabacteria bacterium]
MLNTYSTYQPFEENEHANTLKEKIMTFKHPTLLDFISPPAPRNLLPSNPKQHKIDATVLAHLRHRLARQKNQTAQLTQDLELLQKKASTNVENNGMIIDTVSAKKVPTIYELHTIHGGFHPMSQDLTRFTDLSNPANFETEKAIGVENQQPSKGATVAVVEQEAVVQQAQATQLTATERAKQAFQNYGATTTNPAHPSASFSTFTASPQSPSVEQVIMEQQTQSRKQSQLSPEFYNELKPIPEAELSSNVKTLIRLVNELPEGVTKQTGACIIRLTMEAMGIAMEEVLGEGQNSQSELLENVRVNIKKIEEYKTVIRKLETDIKYFQGRANELSEIIDLFILSNASRTSIEN